MGKLYLTFEQKNGRLGNKLIKGEGRKISVSVVIEQKRLLQGQIRGLAVTMGIWKVITKSKDIKQPKVEKSGNIGINIHETDHENRVLKLVW